MTTMPAARIVEKYAQPDPSTLATIPKGGASLSYMGHAEVTLALIDVDPQWTWEPLTMDERGPVITQEGKRLVMWGRLTMCGKSIIGVGTCDANKGDPEKELIGDFLRNAAMRFGIGTKLWSKAISGDPVGRDDHPEPTYSAAAVQLANDVVAATADKDTAQALRKLGTENGRKPFDAPTFDADPTWAATVRAFLMLGATTDPTRTPPTAPLKENK